MERLTNEQLAEIRKRAEAATAGKWFTVHNTDICVEEPPGSGELDSVAYSDRKIDAEFIAHAREDVPKLLAEIERLKEIIYGIGKLRERIDVLSDDDDDVYNEIFAFEDKCAVEVINNRKERGMFYCEMCGVEYKPETSISKHFCGDCMDENDMVRYKDDWAVNFDD